ncbi:LacI family DNA-binding transcriptional regulator [Amycolatopsis solani]|uniref:LacI family DNA-binding transcriptional regulator n=1 Tax=Amycolatopsis solani TaxID=3028615 RepID=UPI00296EBC02|nr:LacI family DNA-binding transcriptional regulator [Amycolatopsis sp. MEP2-6]
MKRPTITDIAREAGVSKGAVSYALNGRPGVSEATRERITEIARRLGWSPSSSARALAGGRTGAIGLVLDHAPDVLGVEPFLVALLEGVERELGPVSLLLPVHGAGPRKVDGLLLAGPRCALTAPGVPAVLLGGPPGPPGVPSVWVDDAAAAGEVLGYLAALGHRRVVRIAGPAVFADPRARAAAFTAAAGRLGFVETATVDAGTAEAGAGVAHRLLSVPRPPTALVCDTDVLAVAALVAARELGLAVPGDVSVVSWDDSPLCRLVRPALSAVRRPLAELGALAAALLRDLLVGETATDVCAPRPTLVTRGSTGPVRA